MSAKKNILITGGNGQLGSEINEVKNTYPQFSYYFTDIDSLDLSDKEAISKYITQNNIDYIINCAAYTAVDKAEDEVSLATLVNRDAVGYMAEAAKDKAKIIHISTDYVFNGEGKTPYKETDATDPQSTYGRVKREGEEVLLSICPDDSIILRTSWLYSSFGNNFVKTMIRLGKEKESLNVVADQKGSPTYARDLAAAILHIIDYCEKEQQFPAGIYHYSNEGICSWYDFTVKIHELAHITTCKVNPITTAEYPTKAKRPAYSAFDKSKIKNTFRLEIPQWEASLEKCINILTK